MKKIFLILVMAWGTLISHAQQISVNADMTMWLLQTYNLGVEMTIGNRSTLGVSVAGNYHPYFSKEMKVLAVQPEYRYYFGGRPLYHHFVGVGVLLADYNFKRNDVHYDGYAVGAGLTFGYVFALSNKLNLDVHTGVGLVRTSHKETHLDGTKIELDNGRRLTEQGFVGMRILPTKIGVTLSYTLW